MSYFVILHRKPGEYPVIEFPTIGELLAWLERSGDKNILAIIKGDIVNAERKTYTVWEVK